MKSDLRDNVYSLCLLELNPISNKTKDQDLKDLGLKEFKSNVHAKL